MGHLFVKSAVAITVTAFCLIMTAAAVAQDAAVTIAGKWHFVLNTQGGERNVDATFEQDGKNVTGTFGKDDVKGMFADGKLNLEFPINSDEAGPGTLKLTGKLTADALTGDWTFQQYGGTYKATRQ